MLKYTEGDSILIHDSNLVVDILSMVSCVLTNINTSSIDAAVGVKIENILKLTSGFINANNDTVQIIVSRILQQTHKILKTPIWLKIISDNNIFQSIITIISAVATKRKT